MSLKRWLISRGVAQPSTMGTSLVCAQRPASVIFSFRYALTSRFRSASLSTRYGDGAFSKAPGCL